MLLEFGTCETVFGVAESWATDEASGEHTDSTHDGHGDGARAGEAIANDGEHGGPEERLTDGIDAEGDESGWEGIHSAGEVQADGGDGRASEEKPDGGEFEGFLDEMRAEAEAEHD